LLLRGAVAAPALMTVCSGSAAATASNLRCLVNANNMPNPAPAGVTQADTFTRVRLFKRKVCTITSGCTTSEDRFYILGDDLRLLTSRGSGMPGPGQAIRINPSSYQTIGSPGALPAPAQAHDPGGYVNQWAAVRFDSTGKVVGLGDSTQGGMVGSSCWASVASYVL
jgi:hypothetical protein